MALTSYLFIAFSIQTPKENPEQPHEHSLPNAGKLIGIIECFLALGLIIMGQYEAVGLIIAVKSILRFNRTQKSEYVLVGTSRELSELTEKKFLRSSETKGTGSYFYLP